MPLNVTLSASLSANRACGAENNWSAASTNFFNRIGPERRFTSLHHHVSNWG